MATQPLITKSSSKAPLSLDDREFKELAKYEKVLEELCTKKAKYEKKLDDTFARFHTQVDGENMNNFIVMASVGLLFVAYSSKFGWFTYWSVLILMLMLLGLWFFGIYLAYVSIFSNEKDLVLEAKLLDESLNNLFEMVVRFYDHVSSASEVRAASQSHPHAGETRQYRFIGAGGSLEDLLPLETRFSRLTKMCKIEMMSQRLKEKFDGMRNDVVKTAVVTSLIIIGLSVDLIMQKSAKELL